MLLARQQFGAGFTAALTTDLLWRWKMSLPSSSRAPETFWQQLLLSLRPPPGAGLRLEKLTPIARDPRGGGVARGRVRPASTPRPPPRRCRPTAGGFPCRCARARAARRTARSGTASFVPDAAGRWEVRATDPAKNLARVTFAVSEKAVTAESLDLPPDVEGMRRLAQSTGGALIGDEPVFQDRTATAARNRRRAASRRCGIPAGCWVCCSASTAPS